MDLASVDCVTLTIGDDVHVISVSRAGGPPLQEAVAPDGGEGRNEATTPRARHHL
jgi:hypothetical protein